jgi:hypothetical protein
MVQMSMQATTNASALFVQEWLTLRVSEFFSIEPDKISSTVTQSRSARRISQGAVTSQ